MTSPITKFSHFDHNTASTMTFLVVSIQSKVDRNGSDFCELEASDGEQNVPVRLWKTNQAASGISAGDIITTTVTGHEYNGSMSFSFQPASYTFESRDRVGEFVKTAPVPAAAMWSWISDAIASLRPSLRYICDRLISDNKETYLHHAAARSIHHAFVGGLAYHSYRMAQGAMSLASIYDTDRDMCIAGALLHDIGKLREMNTDQLGHCSYTIEGQLKGHLLIGCEMVEEAASDMPEDIKAAAGDDVACLVHIIASHHGKQEMGAIRQPSTKEAFIVSEMDMLDMKLTICEDEMTMVVPGNVAPQDNFVVGRIYSPLTGKTEIE